MNDFEGRGARHFSGMYVQFPVLCQMRQTQIDKPDPLQVLTNSESQKSTQCMLSWLIISVAWMLSRFFFQSRNLYSHKVSMFFIHREKHD